MNYAKYRKKVEAKEQDLIKQCHDLASEIRKEVVLPFCKKWKLTFNNWNAASIFSIIDGTRLGTQIEDDEEIPPSYTEECKAAFKKVFGKDVYSQMIKEYRKVNEILDIPVMHTQTIGEFMDHVRKEDLDS